MKELGNIFSESDLKCDFPARESYREALLSHLLEVNNELQQQASADNDAERCEASPRIIKLSDSDLGLIAAAQGEERSRKDTLDD